MTTPLPSSNRTWVESEMIGVSLGDKRLDRRLIDVVTTIADHPAASNPNRFDWNELRGFYRIVRTQRATTDILQDIHRQRTLQRMTTCPNRVLIVHDTTELNFSHHPALHDDLGPIGSGKQLGFLQHNSLAFDPQARQILGLVHQQMTLRKPVPPKESRRQRTERPHQESELWLQGFLGVGQAPPECRWIDVCDRGGDYLAAMQQSQQLGHEFLIRVCHDRRLTQSAVDEDTGEVVTELHSLRETIRTISSMTCHPVSVASRGGRPKREVRTMVGWTSAKLQPPQIQGLIRVHQEIPVTLIRVWEPGVDEARDAAAGAKSAAKTAEQRVEMAVAAIAEAKRTASLTEALTAEETEARKQWEEAKTHAKELRRKASEYLDWWLGTNSPIASQKDALQAVSDYEWRWPIAEEYHKVEKTGLRIEDQRFESKVTMFASLALMSVVAIRMLQLRYARDEQPDAPASQIATQAEIEMVSKATKYQEKPSTMTVKRFVDGVARLGGYLGRKCDGPPGWVSLWRGYQRLIDMLLGQRLSTEEPNAEWDDNDPD